METETVTIENKIESYDELQRTILTIDIPIENIREKLTNFKVACKKNDVAIINIRGEKEQTIFTVMCKPKILFFLGHTTASINFEKVINELIKP